MIFYSLRLLLQSAFHFESCFYLLWFYLCLRSSHKPVFVRMTPLQSDWSLMGLKGIIPSLLHHTLLGYNFLIPDAVGNTTAYGSFFSPLLRTYCSCDWWAQKHDCLTWKIIMHFYCMLFKKLWCWRYFEGFAQYIYSLFLCENQKRGQQLTVE